LSDKRAVMAVGGHPDDIEFMMAGTLLLLAGAGAGIHMWSMTDGGLGSTSADRGETAALRLREAGASARIAGAVLHRPVARDMCLLYTEEMVARAASVLRRVGPEILLLPAADDYHPDHRNASCIAVSAALMMGVPGFETSPPEPPIARDVTVYHALPFGLRDVMGRRCDAGRYVDIASVMDTKRRMLAAHQSQVRWLEESQGIDCIDEMERMCRQAGRDSGRFEFAEGWNRRFHIGLSATESDPLEAL
jgi:LmbE family N-acetylglucosaminyl deacetylase